MIPRILKWALFAAAVATAVWLYQQVKVLDAEVTSRFEGKRWELPTQVYARPLELHEGSRLARDELVEELDRLGYQRLSQVQRPGQYQLHAGAVDVATRGFRFWDGSEPSRHIRVRFGAWGITELSALDGGEPVVLLRLDPSTIGSIYARHGEDRVLVRLDDVPQVLIDALLAVEDRHFRSHHGVHVQSLVRALLANLRARAVVQGGSTITQQLVKNFYLDNRRTLRRKFDEALMALILDWRYGKHEILEAYINEIYLGQDGDRAVHGFGLGSQFYFQRPLAELKDHEVALLVGIIRGPSYYDPRRRPERARERRDRVLTVMADQQAITVEAAARALDAPLGVVDRAGQTTRYPAFMGLVQRQLQEHYRAEDLRSEGLRIFTTVDPALQSRVERKLAGRLADIEGQRNLPAGSLEAAAVVTDTDTGEVLALVGGRQARFAGFNRALDARRPVGSLIKPFVYLVALQEPRRFDVVSIVEDTPISVPLPGGRVWEPRNFDRTWHGPVPLYLGLTESYNAATVRLGMDVGVETVVDALARSATIPRPPPHPSLLLGAVEMSPVEVADLYQTLASGGYRSLPRAIREVTTADGAPLSRYPLTVARAIDPEPAYLVNRLLQEAIRSGTGRRARQLLPESWNLAGKTGTSDGLRDSWFAGFGGDRLAVVWVGRDDNAPSGLTGATGALPVWIDIMAEVRPRPLELRPPQGVQELWVEAATGLGSGQGCPDAVSLPFLRGTGPVRHGDCGEPTVMATVPAEDEPPGLLRRIRDWFGG
ncbi:MAG: penicillin-binding protein 1B [Gammaproteobacteria bacterium]|nr:penicillin-binding protein 1B [Gammaproteobacteria bacterium]